MIFLYNLDLYFKIIKYDKLKIYYMIILNS